MILFNMLKIVSVPEEISKRPLCRKFDYTAQNASTVFDEIKREVYCLREALDSTKLKALYEALDIDFDEIEVLRLLTEHTSKQLLESFKEGNSWDSAYLQSLFSNRVNSVVTEIIRSCVKMSKDINWGTYAFLATGTSARGEMCPGSDVDLLVILESSESKENFIKMFYQIDFILSELVSPVNSKGIKLDSMGLTRLLGDSHTLSQIGNQLQRDNDRCLNHPLSTTLFLEGDQEFYREFYSETHPILTSETKLTEMFGNMIEDFILPQSRLLNDNLTEKSFNELSFKDIYRALGFFIHVLHLASSSQNSSYVNVYKQLAYLVKQGTLNADFGHELAKTLRFLIKLRSLKDIRPDQLLPSSDFFQFNTYNSDIIQPLFRFVIDRKTLSPHSIRTEGKLKNLFPALHCLPTCGDKEIFIRAQDIISTFSPTFDDKTCIDTELQLSNTDRFSMNWHNTIDLPMYMYQTKSLDPQKIPAALRKHLAANFKIPESELQKISAEAHHITTFVPAQFDERVDTQLQIETRFNNPRTYTTIWWLNRDIANMGWASETIGYTEYHPMPFAVLTSSLQFKTFQQCTATEYGVKKDTLHLLLCYTDHKMSCDQSAGQSPGVTTIKTGQTPDAYPDLSKLKITGCYYLKIQACAVNPAYKFPKDVYLGQCDQTPPNLEHALPLPPIQKPEPKKDASTQCEPDFLNMRDYPVTAIAIASGIFVLGFLAGRRWK